MQKVIIYIFIIFLCLILGVIFFGWPEYKNFNNLKLQIEERKAELENKNKYFSELNSISLKLKEYGSDLSKIDSALPTTSIVPDVINFLAEKSSQNGLILEKVKLDKISPLEKDSKIQKISLTLSLSGFYPALRSFVYSLQKSAKLIEVDSIMFSESQPGGIFSFNLRIKTYSY
jgi:Tfp pilus assembly protein PilO